MDIYDMDMARIGIGMGEGWDRDGMEWNGRVYY
jgi:hypothetical protein